MQFIPHQEIKDQNFYVITPTLTLPRQVEGEAVFPPQFSAYFVGGQAFSRDRNDIFIETIGEGTMSRETFTQRRKMKFSRLFFPVIDYFVIAALSVNLRSQSFLEAYKIADAVCM